MQTKLAPRLAALVVALTPALAITPPGGDALAELIAKEFDTDRSKSVDAAEWQAGIGDGFDVLDRGGDASVAAQELDDLAGPLAEETGDVTAKLLTPIIKRMVLTLDGDADGKVSHEEFTTRADGIFKRLDTDADRSLTLSELAQLPMKMFTK